MTPHRIRALVVLGLATMTLGCESAELKAARLDAEAKWVVAHEARTAVPTTERVEVAEATLVAAQEELQLALEAAEPKVAAAVKAAVPQELRAMGAIAGLAQLAGASWRDRRQLGAASDMVAQMEANAREETLANDPEVTSAREAVAAAEHELLEAREEYTQAVRFAEEATAAAEAATAFYEAAKAAP